MSVEIGDAPPTAERHAIGISFGNSNSSIAYVSPEGKAEVIANEEGDRQIPSILSYIEGEEYHGAQAKSQLVRNCENTIAYFRDFVGKDFQSIDPTPCQASAHPQEHEPFVSFYIQDTESDTRNMVSVSEITTRHIKRLASSASDYLGKTVTAAVITVPTDFSEQQREALSKAAKDAKIDVLQYINEPVAAVLAYDARSSNAALNRVVLVADFGGTRSDVAVIASHGGIYTVLATAHDYTLGGAQLDQVLIDHFAKEFMKRNKTDPREIPRSLAKLKLEAEATKKALSIGSNASLSVESLAGGIDFSSTINRTRYELLAGKVFGGFVRLVEGVVSKADMDMLDIDEVILSGGTSNTPKIARLLQSRFVATTIIQAPSTSATAINPSELAVRGAAIQASLIEEFETEDIEQSTHPMVTVTPHLSHAIGILVISADEKRGIFRPLLAAETAVPARRSGIFSTPKEGGDVLIKLCEGVRHIKITKPEPKQKPNAEADEEEEDSDVDSDGEEEEVREKVWNVGKVLAEAAVKGVKKGGKVEVTANVGGDLGVVLTARVVDGKGVVRGTIVKPRATENGTV